MHREEMKQGARFMLQPEPVSHQEGESGPTTTPQASVVLQDGICLLAGAACVFGFAPFDYYPLPVLMLALLFAGWHRASPWQAFRRGYLFGLGLFGAGIHWMFIGMHDFAGMPALLAILALSLLCAFLALFPALAGYITARLAITGNRRLLLVAPAAWALTEWGRGLIFTGFPWLSLGYSQVSGSPLAGFASVLGVYGVGGCLACCAGCLALLRERFKRSVLLLCVILGSGAALGVYPFTRPVGTPISVRLLQGNIRQDVKWNPQFAVQTLLTYLHLVQGSHEQLVVLPETALPVYNKDIPPGYLARLKTIMHAHQGALLYGVPERITVGTQMHYYNSVFSIGGGRQRRYRKHHLVPFGEFTPPALGWVLNEMHIPLHDVSRGSNVQQPFTVAGQKVAVNICYEDSFGEEIIRQLPQATLLVNVSNDAWFGGSFASAQHLQMSQMRALETGRYLLRATNTGMTAIITEKGRLAAVFPAAAQGALVGIAQAFEGATPYVIWGNAAMLVLALLSLAAGAWRRPG